MGADASVMCKPKAESGLEEADCVTGEAAGNSV